MRRGYTPLKPYLSNGTNQVSRDLRGPTILAMSPRTTTSFMIIRLVMDPWAIPRECSHILSALMHYGTRPRSTESSSHRIWRHCVLICGPCWPIRPLYFSSNSPCRPRLHSFSRSISLHHHHHRSDHKGEFSSPSTICLLLVGTLDILFGGVWVVLEFLVSFV